MGDEACDMLLANMGVDRPEPASEMAISPPREDPAFCAMGDALRGMVAADASNFYVGYLLRLVC